MQYTKNQLISEFFLNNKVLNFFIFIFSGFFLFFFFFFFIFEVDAAKEKNPV